MNGKYLVIALLVAAVGSGSAPAASLDEVQELIDDQRLDAALTLLQEAGRPGDEARRQLLLSRVYTRLGDWPGPLALALTLLGLSVAARPRPLAAAVGDSPPGRAEPH